MFGWLKNDNTKQVLARLITRVGILESEVSELRKQFYAEKQLLTNNEKAVHELREAMQGLVLEHDAVYSFVDLLRTTGIKLKLDYEPVDDEENPDGEIDNGSEKAS